ncbi:MAG: lactonase family protein [Actinobacteria bacterium]|nr:lactonase family protein [Actinomycetota bacterium]
MHRSVRLIAGALLASLLVAAAGVRSNAQAAGTLRQLPGAQGCWVAKRADGCSVYRVPSRYESGGIGLGALAAVIVSPDGRNVYAAANPFTNLIAGFRRRRDGSLSPVAGDEGCVVVGSPRCETPVYRQRELSALAISPDGRNLYAAADYKYVQAVQAFTRLPGGDLRNSRRAISCSGARDRLLGTDRQNRCGLATALGEPSDLIVGPGGHELYAATFERVVILHRTHSGGIYADGCVGAPGQRLRKAPCAPARALTRPTALALSPDGRNLYVASAQGIATFARDPRDGSLTQLAGLAGCVTETITLGCATGPSLARTSERDRNGGNQVAVSPDGHNVYLAARYGIAAFTRDRRTGALTQLTASEACIAEPPQSSCAPGRALHSIEGLAISRDGANVYAASYVSRAVAVLRRTPTGALRQPAGTAGCVSANGAGGCAHARAIGAATAIAIDPTGRTVYVSSYDAGLAIFART